MRSALRRSWIAALAAMFAITGCDSGTPGAGDAGGKDRGRDTATPNPDTSTPDPDLGPGPDDDMGPTGDGPATDGPLPDGPAADGPANDGPAGDLGPLPSDASLADVVFVDAAPPPAGCGDGTRDPGEECDDGNTLNLDGCSSACLFEQVHRISKLGLELGTSGFCPGNAFGSAINALAAGQVQGGLDAGIADGSMTVLLQFLGLDSLDGADDPLLTVGVMGGAHVAGAGYDGADDLDWWYTPNPGHINGARVPLTQLNATISGKTLVAGPASMSFPMYFSTTPSMLKLAHARISADIGAVSAPLTSTGQPPGHVAAEHLDPAISSFETAGDTAGALCGRIPAASLQAMPIPSELTSGALACSEGYSAANSLLDVYVGGCTVIVLPAIKATAPDAEDPDAPPAGAGGPYTLLPNATTKVVDTCQDKNGQAVDLTLCLADAAYSAHFSLASRRVIAK